VKGGGVLKFFRECLYYKISVELDGTGGCDRKDNWCILSCL
jgi:hypothetical protein